MQAPVSRTLLPLALCLALLTPLYGCEDEGVRASEQPQIHVDPAAAEFGAVTVGNEEVETFVIANHGTANLELGDIYITPSDVTAFSISLPPESTVIAPGDETFMKVAFRPLAPGAYSATLVIECNDNRVGGKVEVPLNTRQIEGDLYADPSVVDFGSVEPDTEVIQFTDVVNSGSAAFEVRSVRIVNDERPNDFVLTSLALCSERRSDVESQPADESPDIDEGCTAAEGVIVLEPGSRLRVKVKYFPTEGDSDHAFIQLQTSLARYPTYEVPIIGEELAPRLSLIPEDLDFGPTPLEGDTRTITVRNVGNGQLKIDSVDLAVAINSPFTLVNAPAAGTTLAGEVTFCATCTCRCSDPEDAEGEQLVQQEEITQIACLRETSCDALCSEVEGRVALEPGAPATCDEPASRYDDAEIEVRYTPACTEDGYLPAFSKVWVRSNDRSAPAGGTEASLTGRLDAPGISVRPTQLDFQVVPSGEARPLTFSVYNIGSQPLALTSLAITQNTADSEFSLQALGDIDAIPAGEHVDVEVTFSPTSEGNRVGEITIEHDSPCGDPVVVDLVGRGGGAPYCRILVSPAQVNYGTVAAGRAMPKTVQVRSIGTGTCHFTGASIQAAIAGFPSPDLPAPAEFAVTDTPDREVSPWETAEIEVTYTPSRNFMDSHEGFLVVTTQDPDGSNPVQHNVHLRGTTGNSEIQVLPQELDFGLTTLGCASQTLAVTVYNVGAVNLTIDAITIEPPSPEFEIVAAPGLPAVVNRGLPAQVEVRYVPQDEGPDTADLVFTSDAQNGQEFRVPLRGEGTLDDGGVDEFVQADGQKVDVLFVVDNSGSMGDDQENLSRNFGAFVTAGDLLNPQQSVDFHLGVITTDLGGSDNPFAPGGEMGPERGRLEGDPRYITPDTPNFQQTFETNVMVGDDEGGAQESGLETARAALSAEWQSDVPSGNCAGDEDCGDGGECVGGQCLGYNRGFLRDEAALEIVFLSDEEDQSPSQINFYIDFFKSIKGFRNEGLLRCWAIVGDEPAGCQTNDGSADAGKRYIDVAEATGGRFHSICDDEFAQAMADIGHTAFALRVQFFLSRVADPDSVVVEVNGQEVPAEDNGLVAWEYDPETNSVVFLDEASVPQAEETITIRYRARCFRI